MIAFDVKPPLKRTLRDGSTGRPLEVVDLPSREWVTLGLIDSLPLEDARKLTECDGAWLRGKFPSRKRFSQRVPFAEDREQA